MMELVYVCLSMHRTNDFPSGNSDCRRSCDYPCLYRRAVFCSMLGDEYHFSTSSNKTWLWSPHQLKTTWYLSWDLKRKHLEFIEQLLCTARPETNEMTLSQLGRPSANDGLEDLLAHSLYPFVFFETFDPHEPLKKGKAFAAGCAANDSQRLGCIFWLNNGASDANALKDWRVRFIS